MVRNQGAARGEPTEPPTPQRLAEARRRGDVPVSRALTGAGALAAAVLTLVLLGPSLWRGAVRFAGAQWAQAASGRGSPDAAIRAGLIAAAAVLAPLVGAAVLGALAFGLWQTRGAIQSPTLGWRATRSHWRRSPDHAMGVGLLALAKVAVLAAVAWGTLRPMVPWVVGLAGVPPRRAVAVLGLLLGRLGLRLAVTLLCLGMADYGLQWLAHRRGLRMTRDEIKRQRRETEGDDRLRGRRRELHRGLADDAMPPPPNSGGAGGAATSG